MAYQRGDGDLVKQASGDPAAIQALVTRVTRNGLQREAMAAHSDAMGRLEGHRKTEEELFAQVRKEYATVGRLERVDATHVRVHPGLEKTGPGSFVLVNGKWMIDADAFAGDFKPAELRRWTTELPVFRRMIEIYKAKGPYCWVPIEQLGNGIIAQLNAARAGDAAEAKYITDEREVLECSRAFLRAMEAHNTELAKSQMTPESAADPEVVAFLELMKVNHDGKAFMAARRGEAAKLAREDASRQPELEKKLDQTFAWVDGDRATALALFVFQTPGMTKDDADDTCTRLTWVRSPKGWQLDGRGFVTFGREGAAKVQRWVECVREAMREVETGKAPADTDVFERGQRKYDKRGKVNK